MLAGENLIGRNLRIAPKNGSYKRKGIRTGQKKAEAVKEFQARSHPNNPDIAKSDISEIFNNWIDLFREHISILSSEQRVILFNLSGYLILFMLLTDLTSILIGDHLIQYFKLEKRNPKLAKYIKFKQSLNRYYLRCFYLVYFYFLILIFFL